MKRVLIVEDDMILSLLLAKVVKRFGHEVIGKVSTGENAIKSVYELQPDLMIIDITLEGDLDGIQTMEIIRTNSEVSFFYITGNSDPKIKSRAMKTKPRGFLVKPIELNELEKTLSIALK